MSLTVVLDLWSVDRGTTRGEEAERLDYPGRIILARRLKTTLFVESP